MMWDRNMSETLARFIVSLCLGVFYKLVIGIVISNRKEGCQLFLTPLL